MYSKKQAYKDLLNYSKNVFSQNGEDGIISEILKRLSIDKKEKGWCVEFGAWDGIYLSNTFNLVKQGWKAIYIEGEPKRFKSLLKTSSIYKNIKPVNAFVSKHENSKESLDNILRKTKVPESFDLLSIDIDTFDLEVWESLKKYKPSIVIIEINSSYLPGIINWHSNKHKKANGNSFSATLCVAKKKGYKLICHTGNMIFIREDLAEKINIDKKYFLYPELLFNHKWYLLEQENIFLKFIRKLNAFIFSKVFRKITKKYTR
tara:strand:+ start:74 stop:856 length:783 start_codon:yes stop_codon:yes gene_type:complete